MFKNQTLRFLVNERLTAAAEEIFGLFERTIAEYEKEVYRSINEKHGKQRLLPEANPGAPRSKAGEELHIYPQSPGPDPKHETTETEVIKEEPEEQSFKQEEEQLSVFVPESDTVCMRTDGFSQLQSQTELREETQNEDNSSEPHFHSESEVHTEYSSDWEPLFTFSNAQMETKTDGHNHSQVQITDRHTVRPNMATPEMSCDINDGNVPRTKDVDLQTHIRFHFDDKPYSCSICMKSFARKNYLNSHTRIHTGEKPYSCLLCNKKFSDCSVLRRHKRIHTGEKPYSCLLCNKRFSVNSALITHIRTHTGEKPYSCSLCNKKFSQSSHLRKHMRTHTALK